MSYHREFPDFPLDEMPEIPRRWVDVSWGNDACPSFQVDGPAGNVLVFVDRMHPDNRECSWGRFCAYPTNADGEIRYDIPTVYDGEDFSECCAAVALATDGEA